jgi:Ser/Thr protein kinase RdoA (MazF antagonist)
MSTTAKAHGMDGTLVEPDWMPLDVAEVRTLLGRYPGLNGPVEILTVSPRPFSAASVVATRGEHVFIKRHHRTVRDAEGLMEEHRFMAQLRAHEAPVPRVYSAAFGETAIEKGEWTYEVHEAPDGVDLYGDALSWTPFRTAEHAHSAGQALARLHLAAEGFTAPRRKPRPLIASFTIFAARDPRAEMECYLAARPLLRDFVARRSCCDEVLELLAPFHARLLPLLPGLAPIWTHNDLHASNLLWSDAGDDAQASAIIDFGLADRTNAVHDLAHAIERNIVEWLQLVGEKQGPGTRDQGSEGMETGAEDLPVHLDHLSALLEGYESVRTLSDDEAAALAPMTALCHAEFALSETDYFLSVLHREDQAPMACDGWMVGHARWFRSVGGKKLLDAIGRWASGRALKARGVSGR